MTTLEKIEVITMVIIGVAGIVLGWREQNIAAFLAGVYVIFGELGTDDDDNSDNS